MYDTCDIAEWKYPSITHRQTMRIQELEEKIHKLTEEMAKKSIKDCLDNDIDSDISAREYYRQKPLLDK